MQQTFLGYRRALSARVLLAVPGSCLFVKRAGLRQLVAATPLLDGKRSARDFAAALRRRWQAWCRSRSRFA